MMTETKSKMTGNPFPPDFRRIGISAPASACRREKLRLGFSTLRKWGIEPVPGENLFRSGSRLPYLAADDFVRAGDFNALVRDDSIDAILCARGGYGTPRILDSIDWDSLRRRNLPVIGFSDITALHLAMLVKHAGRPVASQMAGRLGEVAGNAACLRPMKRAFRVLAAGSGPSGLVRTGRKLKVLRNPADVSGPVLPLNLSLAAALCGTEYLPEPEEGTVVVLEDIGDPVRILDRHLNQLLLGGFFRRAGAVVFGQFTECGDSRVRNRLFLDFAERCGSLPVFAGLEYGHELPSLSFVFGEPCGIARDGAFLLGTGVPS